MKWAVGSQLQDVNGLKVAQFTKITFSWISAIGLLLILGQTLDNCVSVQNMLHES